MEWNWQTWLVLAFIVAAVDLVIALMIRNKKRGKSVGGCGCSCENCSMGCSAKRK